MSIHPRTADVPAPVTAVRPSSGSGSPPAGAGTPARLPSDAPRRERGV